MRAIGSLVSVCLCAGNSFAAGDKQNKPGAIPLGPFDLIPGLEVRQGYDDNIYFLNLNKKPSWVTVTRPGLQLALERAMNRYTLSYGLQSTVFWDSPRDNFVDHLVRGDTHVEIDRRNRFDFDAQLLYGHYQRGTYFSRGIISTTINGPDMFHIYKVGGMYTFGAESAKGQFGLDLHYLDQQFDNHLERLRKRNRQSLIIGPGFYFRVLPKTSLLTQFEYERTDYPDATNTSFDFSGDKVRYLVGATWQQTAKTTGQVRIGYMQKQFDDPRFNTISGLSWDANIKWRPLTYSVLTFQTSKNVTSTQMFGNAMVVQSNELKWSHQWDYRFATEVNVVRTKYTFSGSDRSDNTFAIGAEARYRMYRWLNFGLSYNYTSVAANPVQNDYQRGVFMLSIFTNPLAENHLDNYR